MELDLQNGETTERSESSLTKPPSPTTEKLFKVGSHGDGFPSNQSGDRRSDNYRSADELANGDGATEASLSPDILSATDTSSGSLTAPGRKMKIDIKDQNSDDSDPDMPPLEYETTAANQTTERSAAPLMNGVGESEETKETSQDDEDQEDKDGWLDILGNGLMKKKVISRDGGGMESRPVRGERIKLDMEARLDDGTVVESETGYQATVGEGDLNTAVDMCVALMEKGETCELKTDPKYAYGKSGLAPSIPSDAHLTYTLTLHDVQPPLDTETLSIQDRISLGTAKRERGNFYFSRNEHPQALSCYTKALELLRRPARLESEEKLDSDELRELLDVEAKCYNNLAATQLKMEAYDAAIISCDGVIRLQPDNVKALFRKGKALGAKGELDDAIAILRRALKTEPESKLIHGELSRLVAEQRGQNNKERDMYKRMLGQDKVEPENDNSNTTLMVFAVLAVLLALIMGLLLYNNRRDL